MLDCFSCGPDMNTVMPELESAAHEVDIPALKIAVARRRGLSDEHFLRLYSLLEDVVDGSTVNQLRAASGTAAAVLELLSTMSIDRPDARVAIQGAGNMGGATAKILANAGVKIVAWGDEQQCLSDPNGLDVHTLLRNRRSGTLPPGRVPAMQPHRVLHASCDVLVLAAVSRAITEDELPHLKCRGIAVAANLGLELPVEEALHRAGIIVIPDIVASSGGSLAIEAIYAGKPQTGRDILDHVHARTTTLVREVLEFSKKTSLTPRAAALARI
jgi:glutamate dehydrogenase/leucine dehydrogenase